jgi:hypothetical protein
LTGGATGGFQFGVPVKVEYVLEPSAGYSFSSTAGSRSYFEDEDKLPEIVAYLRDHTDIYKGSKIPLDSRVSLDDIYLLNGNLVLTVAYTVKSATITSADFTLALLGDLAAVPLKEVPAPAFTPGTSTKYTTSIAWYRQGEEDALDKDEDLIGHASIPYFAQITLTPATGYTFAGSNEGVDLTAIETALETSTVYGTGGGSTAINLAPTAIGVKGFATQDVLSPADDKIVITLTFAVAP